MRPFEAIVEEHGARVLRVCRAMVGPVDAEDAWSETFLSALIAYPRLQPDSDVTAWLVTIAHRKAVDILRARSRSAIPVEEVPERASALGVPDAGDGDLWASVAALPERQRLAVAYHYLGGLPHRETAELIGGSTDSVRRAAADGIAALRKTYTTGTDEGTERRSS
ncbi:sigma-70 family RNA polymerase sigma factor [Leifsonia bigeumensis]|uniref:Sigma-70 family RNA polymerase sigma factor n=1 Tax=Leifsonella bigeumensis TaxID=433643 RepID=A0ABP7FPE4_9MICO